MARNAGAGGGSSSWRPTPNYTAESIRISGARPPDRETADRREFPAYQSYANSTSPDQRSTAGWHGYRDTYLQGLDPSMMGRNPLLGGSGGAGGGGRGGGGGGGSGLTQAMINAMAQALGAPIQNQALPQFQGQNIAAFDPSMYQQALGQINQGVTADMANINTNQQQVSQNLASNYSNAYSQAPVTQTQAVPQVGAGLMGSVGGTVDPAAAQQVNAQGQNSQAGMQNLMSVLAAMTDQSQQSRMGQVGMDANYARQTLGAQASGMRSQVNMAQAGAQRQWAQQNQERQYQNSMLQQQWNRENLQQQQALANQQRQSSLQPILDMIAQSGSNARLDLSPLLRILGVAA